MTSESVGVAAKMSAMATERKQLTQQHVGVAVYGKAELAAAAWRRPMAWRRRGWRL